jgi:uncharacterized protein
MSMPDFTVTDEYAPAALAAVRLLREHDAIGPVYLAGHSIGGTVAPRIAAAEPAIAGLILLAPGAQPLQWAAVRQFRYLESLNEGTAAVTQATIDAITEQAERVDSPDLSPATPSTEVPLGVRSSSPRVAATTR